MFSSNLIALSSTLSVENIMTSYKGTDQPKHMSFNSFPSVKVCTGYNIPETVIDSPKNYSHNQGRLQGGGSGRNLRPVWLKGGKNSTIKGGRIPPSRWEEFPQIYGSHNL